MINIKFKLFFSTLIFNIYFTIYIKIFFDINEFFIKLKLLKMRE